MRFSILVPVHKTPISEFIRCIKSIKNQVTKYGQRFYDYEVVFIYADRCNENKFLMDLVRKEYALNAPIYRQVWFNKSGKTVSASRQKAFEYSQGDWIVWCDSDDTLQPFALDTLESYIVKGQKKYNCYCFKANIYDNEILDYAESMIDNYVGDYEYKNISSVVGDFEKVPETLWTKCVSSKFIRDNSIEFDPSIKLYDDWFYHNLLCISDLKALKIDKALYNYYIRENSLSTTSEKENKRSYIKEVADKLKPHFEERLKDKASEYIYTRLDKYCEEFLKV